MSCLYIIKVGEICLKGGNRRFFEKKLLSNIRRQLRPDDVLLSGGKGRFYLKADEKLADKIKTVLSRTFGIVAFSRAVSCEKSMDVISKDVLDLVKNKKKAWTHFKVDTRRSDKKFELNSYEISCRIGEEINKAFQDKNVRMKNPDLTVYIEIRDKAYIYTDNDSASGPGGLPVGTAGKGYLMLSGGIDSPVAGYLMAKRGLKLDAVYFHTPPYTSDDSKQKVIDLAKKMSVYFGGMRLFIVNFTKLQLLINEKCRRETTTISARSFMVKITDILAKQDKAVALVTGEALSQVASQTAETLRITGSFTDLPVLRPLIGFDKEDIIKIASGIDTYKTSILPYDDCCSLFAPDHPATRPNYDIVRGDICSLDTEELVNEASDTAELIIFRADGTRK